MSFPHWHFPLALSIAGVWAVSSTALLQKPSIHLPAVVQTGVLVSSRPHSRDWCPSGALVALLRPGPPITLALLRSALGRFHGRCYLTYYHSPGIVDRADSPAFRQVGTDSRLLGVTVRYPNSRFLSPGFVLVTKSSRSYGRWFLTHWPFLKSAFGRWCLRPLADRWPPSSFKSSALLHKLEVLLKISNSQITQNTAVSNRCSLSSRNHRLIIH